MTFFFFLFLSLYSDRYVFVAAGSCQCACREEVDLERRDEQCNDETEGTCDER